MPTLSFNMAKTSHSTVLQAIAVLWCNYHFPAPGRSYIPRNFSASYDIGKLILMCFISIHDSYGENVALGGESCSRCRQPESGSCVIIYSWKHCTFNDFVLYLAQLGLYPTRCVLMICVTY
jgi:hypothetical protein